MRIQRIIRYPATQRKKARFILFKDEYQALNGLPCRFYTCRESYVATGKTSKDDINPILHLNIIGQVFWFKCEFSSIFFTSGVPGGYYHIGTHPDVIKKQRAAGLPVGY